MEFPDVSSAKKRQGGGETEKVAKMKARSHMLAD